MNNRRKYPIGIQTFEDIIEGGYVYVDKTESLYNLVKGNSKYVFLGRPRRFGKSLLISTLKAYFEGKKDLFRGLVIDRLEKDWIKYPVLHISLAGIKSDKEKFLREYLNDCFNNFDNFYGIDTKAQNLGLRLKKLILYCREAFSQRVVLLIDEYDKPVLNVIHDDNMRDTIRNTMSELYAPLKDLDPQLQFVFITGITKFSQMSIFSELNNITNISLREEYSAICGITLDEMLSQMHPDIMDLASKCGLSPQDTIARLRHEYDGYGFSEHSPEIFNPYSLISCFDEKKFKAYWFGSGTPTYLIKMMKKYKVIPSTIGACQASASQFDVPTESLTNIVPLLYQSGYLTIKGYNPLLNRYFLDIPNNEVRVGLMETLLPNYIQDTLMTDNVMADFVMSVYEGNIYKGLEKLKVFFKTVPYCRDTHYEGHWQQMLYVVFSLLNAWTDVEVRTTEGRVDVAILLANKIILIEIKIDSTAEKALAQIDQKNYAERFQLTKYPIIKIGINFNTSTHNMDYLVEE